MKAIPVQPGETFGSWTVVGPSDPSSSRDGKRLYDCQCGCGCIRSVAISELRRGSGQCKQCHLRSLNIGADERRLRGWTGGRAISLIITVGSVFNSWTVIDKAPNRKGTTTGNYWRCRCICGRTRTINAYRLHHEMATRCRNCSARSTHEIEDLTNRTFGKWTAIHRIPPENRPSKDSSWLCRCECGREQAISIARLKQLGGCKKCAGIDRRLKPYEYLYRTIRARILRRYDRSKTHDFTISYENFVDLVNTGQCHYCHVPIEWVRHGGTLPKKINAHHMDRKDNSRGYVPGNVVAACTRCNFGKGARYTYEEWFGMTAFFRHQPSLP